MTIREVMKIEDELPSLPCEVGAIGDPLLESGTYGITLWLLAEPGARYTVDRVEDWPDVRAALIVRSRGVVAREEAH